MVHAGRRYGHAGGASAGKRVGHLLVRLALMMTPIATLAPMRYNRRTLAGEVYYGHQIAKTAFSGGSQVVKQAHRVAPVGKLSTVFGSHRSAAFNLPGTPMVSNPLDLGKLKVSQTARTCVSIIPSRKNISSQFSLASAGKSSIIMNVSTTLEMKSVPGVSSTKVRPFTRPIQEDRMSFMPRIIHQYPVCDYEQALNLLGVNS